MLAHQEVVPVDDLLGLLETLHRTIHEEGLSPADLLTLGYTVCDSPAFSTIGEAWTAGLLVGRVRALSYAHLKLLECLEAHAREVELAS